jgi:hypothetical protein
MGDRLVLLRWGDLGGQEDDDSLYSKAAKPKMHPWA